MLASCICSVPLDILTTWHTVLLVNVHGLSTPPWSSHLLDKWEANREKTEWLFNIHIHTSLFLFFTENPIPHTVTFSYLYIYTYYLLVTGLTGPAQVTFVAVIILLTSTDSIRIPRTSICYLHFSSWNEAQSGKAEMKALLFIVTIVSIYIKITFTSGKWTGKKEELKQLWW